MNIIRGAMLNATIIWGFLLLDLGYAIAFSPLSLLVKSSDLVQHRLPNKSHNKEELVKDEEVSINDSVPSRRDIFLQLASSTTVATTALTLKTQPSFASEGTTTIIAPSKSSNILCDPSVSIFKHPTKKRTVYLLGTAHISSKSADASAQLVRDMKPNAVFVELDAKRVGRAIPKPKAENWPMPPNTDDQQSTSDVNNAASPSISVTVSNTNVIAQPQTDQSSSVKSNKPNIFDFREMALRKGSEVIGNSIKGLYSKLESEGFQAGEEFVVAVREGLKINAKIILGDRDVEVTLRRLTEALAKTDLKKLLAADSELEENMKQLLPKEMTPSDLQNGDMTTDQLKYFVETVKAKDNVRLLMNNLKSVAPEVYQAMVAERDVFMANGLDGLDQFDSIVAVMGIAHVDGVENTLKSRGWVEVKPSC